MSLTYNPISGNLDLLRDIAPSNMVIPGHVVNSNDSRIPKDNLVATMDPSITNDITQGYSPKSFWKNTLSGNIFIAISVITGEAIWKKITTITENGILVVTGGITYGTALTYNITGNTNNLNPPNFNTSTILRLNITSISNITGLIKPTPIGTKEIYIFNTGTANGTLTNNDFLSLPENRFLIGVNILLQPGEGLAAIYDDISLRYRCAAKNT